MAWIYWYENYQNTLINWIDWDSFGFVNRETSMSLLKIRASFAELSRIETGLSWTSFTVNSFEKMHLTNCMIFLFFDCIYLLWNDSSKASPQIALVVPIWFDKIRICMVSCEIQSPSKCVYAAVLSQRSASLAIRSTRVTEVFWIPIWFKESHTTALIWRSTSVSSSSTTNFRFRASCLLSINNTTNVSSINTKEKTANPKPIARWYWKGEPSWVIQVKKLSITKKPVECYITH